MSKRRFKEAMQKPHGMNMIREPEGSNDPVISPLHSPWSLATYSTKSVVSASSLTTEAGYVYDEANVCPYHYVGIYMKIHLFDGFIKLKIGKYTIV